MTIRPTCAERGTPVRRVPAHVPPWLLPLLSLALVAPLCAADAERFTVAGPDQVVDGWVASTGAASFGDEALRGGGKAWATYHRCLIRFDLGGIDAARFAGVRKATLRLRATKAANPAGVETRIAPMRVAWTTAATWGTPDGTAGWPQDRNRATNIDYAVRWDGAAALTVDEPGAIAVDLTAAVGAWLYEGTPNHGLLIRTGGTIFGNPGAGTWDLALAGSESAAGDGPALIVEMAGVPPTPAAARARALALYPSALLPPVRQPWIIVWYGIPRAVCRRQTATNMTTYRGMGNWLAARGGLDLGWAEGGPSPWLSTEQAWIDYYLSIAGSSPGYCMHEWHLPAERRPWAVAAVRAAERRHPECFSAFYYQGQRAMADLAAAGSLDLLILEGYTNVISRFPIENFAIGMAGIRKRVDVARDAGAIERLVVMLGHIAPHADYHAGHELTAAMVDEQIAQLRAHAPEMPGIGFYYSGGVDLALQCDVLARRHFIDPAPEVVIAEPAFEARLHTPHVTLRAEATPREGRTIARYRWFIDSRLVAETSEPRYTWDLRGEHDGRHLVTVHAVDSGFDRGACQIPVRVDLGEGRVRAVSDPGP